MAVEAIGAVDEVEMEVIAVAVHAQDGAHILFAHQRLERPHTAADIEADEHSAEVKDIDELIGHFST